MPSSGPTRGSMNLGPRVTRAGGLGDRRELRTRSPNLGERDPGSHLLAPTQLSRLSSGLKRGYGPAEYPSWTAGLRGPPGRVAPPWWNPQRARRAKLQGAG